MLSTNEIDLILAKSEWDQWRESNLSNPSVLAEAARAWCSSSHWKENHTPYLETWKAVVSDLAQIGLNETALTEMVEANGNHLPFPLIPLFESEQLQDLCGILRDADAAAALVEKWDQEPAVLDLDLPEAAEKCWQALSPSVKQDIDFSAWVWMLPVGASRTLKLPSKVALEQLGRTPTPRRSNALQKLRGAFGRGAFHDLTPERHREFSIVLGLEPPAVSRVPRLEPIAKLQSREAVDPLPRSPNRYEILAQQLFQGSLEIQEWAEVATQTALRPQGSADLHPLLAMAVYLQTNDFPDLLDDNAWKSLEAAFRAFPTLLEADSAKLIDPLPALVLARAVRSMVAPGLVVLGLLPLAGKNKRNAIWWKAILRGLHPVVRRGVWGNANDCRQTAIQVVRLASRTFDPSEAAALNEAFKGEID